MSQQFLPPGNKYTGSFTEDTEGDGVRLNAFNHEDADVAFDPLSANRRFSGTADLAVLGTLVFAGPIRETISVMVPDCLMPPENDTVRVDLRHHVGLSLGPAVDMTNWSSEDHLERALCPGSLADTLGLQRREYWEELNPILKRWKSVNKSSCPDCQKFIQINIGRHIRLNHTTYMCFWRCPVVSCSLWFTAELNAKDHIEGIHKFKEGEGTSFYECLRRHGIEWFGSRRFFEQRKETNQALWMDMALARRSGQELRNSYIITNSPEYAPLRRFFKAAVDGLQMVFDRSLVTSVQPKSLLIQMREAVADCDDGSSDGSLMLLSPPHDIPAENDTVRVDLRHHVGLSLGPAVDMTNWSSEDHLERALCPGSLADTLGLQRREYWEELNPILKRWKSVNKSSCPDCQKFIQINMGRHIRLNHTTYMCFWRCPVVSCSLWFTAELNAKDIIDITRLLHMIYVVLLVLHGISGRAFAAI